MTEFHTKLNEVQYRYLLTVRMPDDEMRSWRNITRGEPELPDIQVY